MTFRMGDWKLIASGFRWLLTASSRGSDGRRPARPALQFGHRLGRETNNLYLTHPDIVARLSDELTRIQKEDKSR
jgi:hypothetical protein